MDMYYVPHLIELVEGMMNEGTAIFLPDNTAVDLRVLRDRLVLYREEWITESDLRSLMGKVVRPDEIIRH